MLDRLSIEPGDGELWVTRQRSQYSLLKRLDAAEGRELVDDIRPNPVQAEETHLV